ncbi:hypothetical protein GpartN1_g3418.t1 [Galdieria partita]|uniref:Archaeal ATPase n=1 Tax=Galdieria partita TaxID=83374 RepID=A0A9C7PXD4_9RHOD|nr:hypothetical protein GpartN1_g3418.t1 [Galdieria partita]
MSSVFQRRDMYDSVVVDREQDVVLTTGQLYGLQVRRELERSFKPVIPFAPHLFGSGKTRFVKSYLELLKSMGERALIGPENISDCEIDRRRSFLDKLHEAVLLYVDLTELKPTNPIEEKRNLEWAVHYLLFKSACLKSGQGQPDPDECFKVFKLRTDVLIKKIREVLSMRTDQFLLVAFDEVGVLDTRGKFFDLEVNDEGRVRPYNDFFGIIRGLCKEDNVFFIVVGKSEGLSIHNYAASVSRVELTFIPLSPLEKHSIIEHLEKSSSSMFTGSPKVSQILCHQHFSTNELAELLLELTGGVPGLLVKAINYLLHCKLSQDHLLLSKESFWMIMNDSIATNYCVDPLLPRLSSLSETRQRLLKMLTLLALYHIRFELGELVHLSSTFDVFLFDLVTDMCFYRRLIVDENHQERYEVLIHKLLIGYIEQIVRNDRLEWLLLQTLKSQPVEFFYESKCRVFEGLVATMFYLHFCYHPTDSLMFSILGQLSSVWKEMNLKFSSESTAYYMKSIHYTRSTSEVERTTFGINDWKEIVEEMLEFEKIYIPFEPTSRSPDILFKLHGRTSGQNLIVGIACKGRWSSNGIRWNEIVDEACKFLQPVHDQVVTVHPTVHDQVVTVHPTLHCMLVIMSTKLSTSVATDLNHSSHCYSFGDRVAGVFTIPLNCELIILSESDVENFIGKDILSSLRSAFKSTDNPHSRSIGISTVQEMVLSLSKNI